MAQTLEQLIFETQQEIHDQYPDLTNDDARKVALELLGVTS